MQAPTRRQFLNGGGVAAVMAGGVGVPLTSVTPAGAQDVGTTFDGFVNDRGGQVFNVTNPAYGAKADTIRSFNGGAISADTTTFKHAGTTAANSTSQAPVAFVRADIGKVITVQGAGLDGAVLSTTILDVTDENTAELADAAATTVADAEFSYGSDDTRKILAAIDAAGDTGTVYLPAAIYTILGASNGGKPIKHSGRGGIVGRGGTYPPTLGSYRLSNTVLLCGDATAGLIANGSARYESFMCDGNNIANVPLQNGVIENNRVVDAPAHATFRDVRATKSAGVGWAIYGVEHSSFYDCGSTDNESDGLYIDGGSSGLVFTHLQESGNYGYGIHGDHVVAAVDGSTGPTRNVRFYSGLCDGNGLRPDQRSKVYLRGAIGWRFQEIIIVGIYSPVVDLDQSSSHGLDFSDVRIISGAGNDTEDICIRISGTPPDDTARTFIRTDGCFFMQAKVSISVLGDPRSYRYSAVGGWDHAPEIQLAVADGLPAADTLFTGRVGTWQTAAVLAPWTGTITYRITAERLVELRGNAQYSGTGDGPMFTLPRGYRPSGTTRLMAVRTSSGPGVVAINPAGEVSARPSGDGTFPAATDVSVGRVRFPLS